MKYESMSICIQIKFRLLRPPESTPLPTLRRLLSTFAFCPTSIPRPFRGLSNHPVGGSTPPPWNKCLDKALRRFHVIYSYLQPSANNGTCLHDCLLNDLLAYFVRTYWSFWSFTENRFLKTLFVPRDVFWATDRHDRSAGFVSAMLRFSRGKSITWGYRDLFLTHWVQDANILISI